MTETVQIEIHPIETEEVDAAVELVRRTLGEYDAYDYDTGNQQDLDPNRMEDLYSEPKGRFWVAKAGEVVVGTVGLRRVDDRVCRMTRLSVHADYRKHDVVQQLAAALEAYAREQGYRRVITELQTRQKPAATFLESIGFEEYKRSLRGKGVVISFEKAL